ncbi:hypothetical protein C2I18_09775 [Paenibacillus sp. PK3_47]|nr:hypothetical protein C2I18_09775 [Paenibacillus sp. PK3_47]
MPDASLESTRTLQLQRTGHQRGNLPGSVGRVTLRYKGQSGRSGMRTRAYLASACPFFIFATALAAQGNGCRRKPDIPASNPF